MSRATQLFSVRTRTREITLKSELPNSDNRASFKARACWFNSRPCSTKRLRITS